MSVLLTDLFSARLMSAAVVASPHTQRTSGAVAVPPEAQPPEAPVTAEVGPDAAGGPA